MPPAPERKEYIWSQGARDFRKFDPNVLGPYIESRNWTPEEVIEDARRDRSPFHEPIIQALDQDELVHQALIDRAKSLLNSIRYVTVRVVSRGEQRSEPKHVVISVPTARGQTYKASVAVLSNAEERLLAIRSALIHARGTLEDYKNQPEVRAAYRSVSRATASVLRQMERPPSRRRTSSRS